MYNSNELKDLNRAVSTVINEATNQYDGDFKVGQKVYVTDGNSGVDFEGTIKAFVGRDQIQVKGTGADRGKTETEHGKFIVSQDDKTFGEATEVKKKKLDKPGEEDADIDNDGDTDSSDKYLAARRKAITKAVKKDKEVNEVKWVSYNKATKKEKIFKTRDGAKKHAASDGGEIYAADYFQDHRKEILAEDSAQFHMVKLAVDASHTDEQIREFLSQRDGELFESTIFEVITEFDVFIAEAKDVAGAELVKKLGKDSTVSDVEEIEDGEDL